MSGMPASALRYFLAVSHAGTFRHAANLLHVSASAINRQISLLEVDLGAPLFERGRGRNKLKLTAAGEILLLLAKAHIEPKWSASTTSYEMLRSLARAGLGAAIVSDYLVNKSKPSDAVLIP